MNAEVLRRLVAYDPKAGVFTNLVWRGPRAIPGQQIGHTKKTGREAGYVVAEILGKSYSVHRLAWLYVHGEWPTKVIDHINGDRTDNRIANLRDVDLRTNMQNLRGPMPTNTTGYLGVSKEGKRFKASIWIDGKQKSLGRFETAELAHDAYISAKRKHHAGCTI